MSEIGKLAAQWWYSALADTGPGRKARAELRRCDSPADALLVPATHDLHRALGGGMAHRGDRLALIAVALANVRETGKETAPERMGEALSALRFQSLLRTTEPAALIRPLRRALAQIDNRANVAALAGDLFHWNERTRERWAFAYYGAALPQPAATPDTADATEESDA